MLQISVLYKLYLASRLAFLAMGEPLPEQVDHLNGDSLDNRWLNFKPSTATGNAKNQSMHRNNTSGVSGVSWDRVNGKWQADVKRDGKKHRIGRFSNIDEATVAVSEFRAENGFSARHGQELAWYVV
jgi:hypothetical protein